MMKFFNEKFPLFIIEKGKYEGLLSHIKLSYETLHITIEYNDILSGTWNCYIQVYIGYVGDDNEPYSIQFGSYDKDDIVNTIKENISDMKIYKKYICELREKKIERLI